MPTKYDAATLKNMKAPDLRNAARAWGVSVAGKKPADIIREIMSKQNGGKTPATASTTTKMAGKPAATKPAAAPGKSTVKPMPAKPAAPVKPAPKAPVAPAKPTTPAKPAAKPAAPPAKPVAKPAAPTPTTKAAPPPPVPANVKAPSADQEAKFKALVKAEVTALVSTLSKGLQNLREEFDALKSEVQAAMVEEEASTDESPAEEEVTEEATEGEVTDEQVDEAVEQTEVAEGEEVTLTQEEIESADINRLIEIADALGVEKKGAEKSPRVLRARILKHLQENAEVTEEVPADREATTDMGWIGEPTREAPTHCLAMDEGEWKEGYIMEITSTGALTVFVVDPSNPEEGWEFEAAPESVQPFPEEVAEGEEVAEEAVEEEQAAE